LNQLIRLGWKKNVKQVKILAFIMISALLIWELVNTTMLITMDFNSWQFDKFALDVNNLTRKDAGNWVGTGGIDISTIENATEIVSNPVYSWIYDLIQSK
jgi:hypothetical protein